ncbi:MAG: LpxL/LpxP family Kdo(2)-lipid IV(A) lauroyl/palmitoleoyl acyltransferase [Gammaproteobacteria bacterium]|nr:LpxL/LpxP family Kdo(2)-lipid IV(A) lauroyl/palmitoleoyl acyltransferase [Gammaproteobacteria bacterium]
MAEIAPPPFHASHYLAPRHWLTWIGLGLLRLVVLLPYPIMMWLGGLLGQLMYGLMRCRRSVAATNIDMAFPQLSEPERKALIVEHFRNSGRTIIESALSWWGKKERLNKLAHIHNLEYLTEAAAKGKGVVLLSAHFTSFEIAARLLTDRHPLQFLYKEQKGNPLFESYTTYRRLHYFARAITHHDLRGMIRGLKEKLTCWYLPDQDFGTNQSLFAPFMGVSTSTITTTSRIARMSGAVVVPYFPLRRHDGSGYDIHILPPLENFPSGDELADASLINQLIETYVKQEPAQYLWMHRRFRTRPDNAPSPYEC